MPQITAGVYFQLQQRDLSALGQYVCSNLGIVQSVHIPGQYVYTICVHKAKRHFPSDQMVPSTQAHRLGAILQFLQLRFQRTKFHLNSSCSTSIRDSFPQVCRYNCPDPVCGDSGPGVVSTSTYNGPSPPVGYSANQRIDLNNRVYNVDPRNPGGPRTAGLIMDDATLDKLSAPKTEAKTGGRNLVGGPHVGGRRRGGPSPPAQRSPPRAPVFPKIPGLTKRLGDLLAGKAAVNREEGRSLNSRPVLKRLYKREADGQEMADIDMAGIIQV